MPRMPHMPHMLDMPEKPMPKCLAWRHMRRWSLLVLVIGLLTAAPTAARADSIKVAGQWIDGVSIETVAGGQLVYRLANGSRVTRPLDKTQGLKLDDYPALAEAEQALADGKTDQAIAKFRAALSNMEKANRDDQAWIGHYVQHRLVQVFDGAGQAVEATQMYLQLAKAKADASFVTDAPVTSVRRADEQAKQKVAKAVNAALSGADDAVKPELRKLIAATEQEAVEQAAVVLPANLDNDQVTQLLRRGEFEQALKQVETTLRTSGQLSKGFYQKGKAQLALAEKNNDQKQFKDAGLSFMRVIAYFPNSQYVGPALVEVGYVHARIGRPDLARKLYDRARIQIDEEQDPAYHQRLMKLIAQLEKSEQGSKAEEK